MGFNSAFKGLNAKLNPICHLLALLGAHHFLHVSGIRVNVSQTLLYGVAATLAPLPPLHQLCLRHWCLL
jgi:hypothetical protein